MAVFHLTNWSVQYRPSDPFKAPEQCAQCLAGLRVEDNKHVLTSAIEDVDGRRITTWSGSVYILEDVSVEYLAFLKQIGHEYDPENPIKDKRSK